MALSHSHLHIHTCYSGHFLDPVAEDHDGAIRVGTLQDSNLGAGHIGPLYGRCGQSGNSSRPVALMYPVR
jgi:hypothetical protein